MIRYLFLIASLSLWAISSHASLYGRLPDGDGNFQAYYDDATELTWLANANPNDILSYWEQGVWVNTLNINGIDDWRFPSMDVNDDGVIVDCSITDASACLDNEYGYMYWFNGINATSPNPFNDIIASNYLSSTAEVTIIGTSTIVIDYSLFNFGDGTNHISRVPPESTYNPRGFIWAVRDGDIPQVPIPAAVWLFSSGLIGLIGFARRKKA